MVIDHRSYERQGVDLLPTIHEGATVRAMEKKGIRTEKGEFNRWIKATNAVIRDIKKKITLLFDWIAEAKAELAKPQAPDLVSLLNAYYTQRRAGAYSQKGKVSNLKEMNETFNYLRANGIYSLEDLEHRVSEHSAATESLKKTLDEQTARMKAIKQLYDSSAAFQSLKPVYDGLQKIKFEKPRAKYKAEHEAELIQFYAARRKLTGEFPDGKVDDKLGEIWSLLTESPQTFKGGQVWGVMTGIHGALQAIGYGLLVLFFAVGVMKTCGSFVEVKKPEHALKLFIRFALAKGAVTYGLELMLAVFSIVQGMVSTIITQSGSSGMSSVTLPQELIDAINNVGFWDSIPLWAVTLIGGLLITVLSFTMILTVYGRMFSLWMYAAIAPIPLSTFAGEPTGSVGKNFIRSYAGVCLQGVVIALSCIIFSAISSSPPAVDTGASVVTAVWTYVGELAFNLLVLVGAIKGCDRIAKEIMGL